ncbi:MAG TPA: hypothetical protein VKV21_00185 [Solirubrobacteraceae bacterium]|nr:hypothetical protein [Solirubrobacteraceae bacterium]
MPRLIRLDPTGHTELAEWTAEGAGVERARAALIEELEHGYFAVATGPDGTAEQIRELPSDAELVVLRRPIAGG